MCILSAEISMGIAKKILSLSVSFFCFVCGVFGLLVALRDLSSVETTKITWIMGKSNNISIETVEDGLVSGSRIVALLLRPLDCEVKLNGNKVITGSTIVTNVVDIHKKYWLKREYEENFSKPTLLITEYVEE